MKSGEMLKTPVYLYPFYVTNAIKTGQYFKGAPYISCYSLLFGNVDKIN